MKEKMAKALIDIRDILPYCLEEEAANQNIPEEDLCSNILVDLWRILHRFKYEELEIEA